MPGLVGEGAGEPGVDLRGAVVAVLVQEVAGGFVSGLARRAAIESVGSAQPGEFFGQVGYPLLLLAALLLAFLAAPVLSELLLDDRVGVRVVRAAAGRGELLRDALPLRELRSTAAAVVGLGFVAAVQARLRFRLFAPPPPRCASCPAHGAAPRPADLRVVDRCARGAGAAAGLGGTARPPPVGRVHQGSLSARIGK
ncbi:hypothetical protein [Streptomyces sp. KN37]|uniref:hypothetical protein n=1 Tax=Streptomyces sp. KN37 TaxID=3090667 RepID=UPI002A74EA69|nr:hypothetical protein [Streptomyces sp. KN37]WPO69139.1 hypothetical protein R9806_00025 [Streptomyces sp. KN37]